MSWLRRNPVFYASLGLLMVAVLAGVWLNAREQLRLAELKSNYERKALVLDAYLVKGPSPTKANLEKLDRNYARLYERYGQSRDALNLSTYDPGLFFGDVPATRTDAFFEIARYIEEARVLAASNRVVYDAGSRFGFEEYANVGPVEDLIPNVHKQVKVMSTLVHSLFDSGIAEFVEIRREGVAAPGRGGKGAKPAASLVPLERFVSVARQDGVFDSMAFRVVFKGQTNSLRNFLNRIEGSSLPYLINNVEVNFQSETAARPDRPGTSPNPFFSAEVSNRAIEAARVPIIAENQSIYTVTIEFVESLAQFDPPETEQETEAADA